MQGVLILCGLRGSEHIWPKERWACRTHGNILCGFWDIDLWPQETWTIVTSGTQSLCILREPGIKWPPETETCIISIGLELHEPSDLVLFDFSTWKCVTIRSLKLSDLRDPGPLCKLNLKAFYPFVTWHNGLWACVTSRALYLFELSDAGPVWSHYLDLCEHWELELYDFKELGLCKFRANESVSN